ncbi:MAG: translation elongation factor Ts [Candidatus Amesbacteria bacterium]|nr:translation elongation factor Ts [Candidatus Amesbacteria bacterium]
MKVNLEDLKKLREETKAGVADCRSALEETEGDLKKATEILRKKGIERAEKKSDREVKAGMVFSYIHHTGRVGSIVSLACETDFVAKTDDFQKLGREIAMHLAATNDLEAPYVRDASKTIKDLIKEVIGKLGENIQVVEYKVVVI